MSVDSSKVDQMSVRGASDEALKTGERDGLFI